MSLAHHRQGKENELQMQQQSPAVQTVKKMQSILPDHLEAIEEGSEEAALFEIDSMSSGASTNTPEAHRGNDSEHRDDTLSSSYNNQQYLPPAYNTINPVRPVNHRPRKEHPVGINDKHTMYGRYNRSPTIFAAESGEDGESGTTAKTDDLTDHGSSNESEEKDDFHVMTGGILLSSLSSSSSSRKSNLSTDEKERIDHLALWGNASIISAASNFDYDNEFEDIENLLLNKHSKSNTSEGSNSDLKASITDLLDRLSFADDEDDISEIDDGSERADRSKGYQLENDQNVIGRDSFSKTKRLSSKKDCEVLIDEMSGNSGEDPEEKVALHDDYQAKDRIFARKGSLSNADNNQESRIDAKVPSNGGKEKTAPRNSGIVKRQHVDNTKPIEDEIPWRMEPSESLSDWILLVQNKTSNEIQTYHVHKNFLALGPRKSEYFLGIFKSHDPDVSPNMTEIELLQSAADVVPDVLDYIYAEKIVFSSKTALGIRFLSQCFGIKVLYQNVMKFILQDLTIDTAVVYYITSTQLGDQKIRGIASRHCARNIMKIDCNHALLKYMDPFFFSSILSHVNNDGSTNKKMIRAISLLTEYCRLHRNVLTRELFAMLTSDDNLQKLDHESALVLLEIESEMMGTDQRISKLQNRCLNILAAKWKFLCENDPERTAELCTKLPSLVVSELMIRSLLHAKDSINVSANTNVTSLKGSTRSLHSEKSFNSAQSSDVDSNEKTPSLKRRNGSSSVPDSKFQSKNTKGKEAPARAKSSQITNGQDSAIQSKRSRNASDPNLESSKQSTIRKNEGGAVVKRTSPSGKLKSSEEELRNSPSKVKDNGPVRKRVVDAFSRFNNRSIISSNDVHDSDRINNGQSSADNRSRPQKNDYQMEIDRLRRLCAEKDKQISLYKNELQKFRRLPNQPDGKIVKSGPKSACTLPSAQLLGGVKHEKDGFLLSTFVNGSKKYPLFYFKDDSSVC